MSWWSSSEIEKEINKATSSNIPSGEQDLALNLEISDYVRSKQASTVEVLRVLKKRLYDRNPNVQILTLHLLDLLVKNGGLHFLVELAKKDFVDAYVAQLMSLVNQNRNQEVIDLMLEYFQTWALASQGKPEFNYLQDKYQDLKRRRDIKFPEDHGLEISSSFLESATAPEWTDSDTCMKSGQPFTFYNRKHHCRNCGGVFLQEYCSNFRPLPHFGITIPVRVCDDCDTKLTKKYDMGGTNTSETHNAALGPPPASRKVTSNNRDIGSKYQEDLEQAIRLSLQGNKPAQAPHTTLRTGSGSCETVTEQEESEEEMDEDLKQAIASSLAEMNRSRPAQASNPRLGTPHEASQGTRNQFSADPVPASQNEYRDAIESFYTSVETAGPREATYNPTLIELNRKSIEIQPKIISELRLTSSKLSTLEDLHGKLLAVAKFYDALLEAELRPELSQDHDNNTTFSTLNAESPEKSPNDEYMPTASEVPSLTNGMEKNVQDNSKEIPDPSITNGNAATNAATNAVKNAATDTTTTDRNTLGEEAQSSYHEPVSLASSAAASVQKPAAEPGAEPLAEPTTEPEPEPEPEPTLIEL